jgi:hypothetical protein
LQHAGFATIPLINQIPARRFSNATQSSDPPRRAFQRMRQVVVRTAHQVPERAAIQVTVGEHAQIGERDREWPKFVFVTTTHGTGWVPARHLSQQSGEAVVEIGYDTTELPTRIGEVLEVLTEDRRSGWVWCRSSTGREGWVPIKTLDTTQEPTRPSPP